MNEMSGEKLEELLSCYIDGELSERQQTEIKRLIEHDAQVAGKVARLEAQKAILNELPVESVPSGLLSRIEESLERSCILADYAASTGESAGARHLLARRTVAAAIILVLFGILVSLVVNVMLPSVPGDVGIASVDTPDSSTIRPFSPVEFPRESVPAIPVTGIFTASLDLATRDPIQMNALLRKSLHNNDLLGCAEPPKPDDPRHTTTINCRKYQVIALLSDLQTEWDRCDRVTFVVKDYRDDSDVTIKDVTYAQVVEVFSRQKIYNRIELAKDYSDFNSLTPSRPLLDSLANLPSIVPIKPELTSDSLERDSSGNLVDQEKIKLVITITPM